MTRPWSIVPLACLAALVGCFESHSNQLQELRGTDCAVCHTIEYDATSQPPHAATGFPTTCADCHRSSDWQPALGGLHPAPRTFLTATGDNETFLLEGVHDNLACLGCHDLDVPRPSGSPPRGFDTNCIQCHPNDAYQRDAHVGIVSATNEPYQYRADIPSFCRACHPQGTASKHPNTVFPRAGNHNVACASCHLRADGPDTDGTNTSCIEAGCHHTLSWSDGKHDDIDDRVQYTNARNAPPTGNITPKNFCRLCHRGGGGGD